MMLKQKMSVFEYRKVHPRVSACLFHCTHLRNTLYSWRGRFGGRPHSIPVGVTDNGGSTPAGTSGKVVGVSFLAPLAPKGAVVAQGSGIALVDVGVFELQDPKGLFAALSRRLIELTVGELGVRRGGDGARQEEGGKKRSPWREEL